MSVVSSIGIMLTRYDPAGVGPTLDMLEEIGADHVEINAAATRAILGGALRRDRLRGLERALAGRRLGVTVHAPLALNFMDDSMAADHAAVGAATVDLCAALGATCLVVHPGWVEGRRLRVERDRLMAMERDGLRALAEQAASVGVVAALENMPTVPEALTGALLSHGLDCASVRAQVEAVDHPNLRATIDVSHAYIASGFLGASFPDQLRVLAPVTRHLHLHDSFGRAPALPRPASGDLLAYGVGDLHLPLGWGSLPWESVLPGLPLPNGVSMTLEILPEFAAPETVRDSLARARSLAARMEAAAASAPAG